MQEAVTSSTRLLCPAGHGLQSAKRSTGHKFTNEFVAECLKTSGGTEWLLECGCYRGYALPSKAKIGIQTPAALQKPVEAKAVPVFAGHDDPIEDKILDMPISPFNPEVEYEERAPQEQEVGSGYVRPSAREAGDYAAFVGKTS